MEPEEDKIQIDPELWLRILMDLSTDPKDRARLVAHLSQKSGVADEKVDEILHLMMETLFEITRSN
ncbi:MAG: hypothetical protein KBE23_12265 [Chloroflexi bacterium]|nr:hypothetical protein [Chloroflexota bacterium]MBP7043512.1 hypothetical protein [Chloroflexota bacterium]